MLSAQAFLDPLDDFPEVETNLGLFFSNPQSSQQRASIGLQLSSPLLSDSLFLKQVSEVQPTDDALTRAHIYFPEVDPDREDTLRWPVAQPTRSFSQVCREQQKQPDQPALQALVLKLCNIMHVIHSHQAANFPITPHMLRIAANGDPLLLLLPISNLEALSQEVRQAFFPPLFSAPETQGAFSMNPQAFSYNVGVLTAMLNGFSAKEMQDLNSNMLAWLNSLPESSIKELLLSSLHQDAQARPYCPMQMHKALCGSLPDQCKNCRENLK
jgi:hypothetical protein